METGKKVAEEGEKDMGDGGEIRRERGREALV